MADTRLNNLTATPVPIERDSLLFIERESGGAYISEKTTVSSLTNVAWRGVIANPFTATLNDGHARPVDTTSGTVTLTLTATPIANDKVYVMDYNGNFAATSCFINRNGSNIMGLAENLELDVDNVSVELTYIDITQGWRITSE